MEQVISEFKIIETDDGYRIEIKGDKARLKQLFERGPFGARMGGPFGFRGPMGGPLGWMFGRHHWGHGPWGWHFGEEEESAPPAPGV